jgi:hypothetical protein
MTAKKSLIFHVNGDFICYFYFDRLAFPMIFLPVYPALLRFAKASRQQGREQAEKSTCSLQGFRLKTG